MKKPLSIIQYYVLKSNSFAGNLTKNTVENVNENNYFKYYLHTNLYFKYLHCEQCTFLFIIAVRVLVALFYNSHFNLQSHLSHGLVTKLYRINR